MFICTIIISKSYKSSDPLVSFGTKLLSYEGDYASISIMEHAPVRDTVIACQSPNKTITDNLWEFTLISPLLLMSDEFDDKLTI